MRQRSWSSTPEGAENASQQVRGCAAGTLTGRESACGLSPITSRHLHGRAVEEQSERRALCCGYATAAPLSARLVVVGLTGALLSPCTVDTTDMRDLRVAGVVGRSIGS